MRRVVLSLAASSALFLATAVAQQPTLKLAATSVNVSGPGMSVRIDIFRWSTDHERSQLLTAKRLSPDKPAKLHSDKGLRWASGFLCGMNAWTTDCTRS